MQIKFSVYSRRIGVPQIESIYAFELDGSSNSEILVFPIESSINSVKGNILMKDNFESAAINF